MRRVSISEQIASLKSAKSKRRAFANINKEIGARVVHLKKPTPLWRLAGTEIDFIVQAWTAGEARAAMRRLIDVDSLPEFKVERVEEEE
jgi:hypothetical protein